MSAENYKNLLKKLKDQKLRKEIKIPKPKKQNKSKYQNQK